MRLRFRLASFPLRRKTALAFDDASDIIPTMSSIQQSLRPRVNAVAKELEAISTELTLESLGLSCMYLALAKGIASHDASREGDTFTFIFPRIVLSKRQDKPSSR